MDVLITGANRGIGRELAQSYRARGDKVIATARRPSGDEWPLDLARQADFDDLAQRLEGHALSLLICNAGVYADKGVPIEGLTRAIWDESFATNVTGAFMTVRACLPALRRGGGKIALISSVMASDAGAPGGALAYRASKAALLNLGRNLAVDLELPVGIYHPGWVRTDMGGPGAAVSVETAAAGLIARFDALSSESSGEFLSYDGSVIPF